MSVGTRPADISLLLGRCRAVRTGSVAFLLGFGLHLACVVALWTFACALEGYTIQDDVVNIVAAELIAHDTFY